MEEVEAEVDWQAYFDTIKEQCPWSHSAYHRGKIDIVQYQGDSQPLGDYEARMYVVNAPEATVESLAEAFDYRDTECEWLFSYPGYGPFATPVPVLIQQDRARLNKLREQLNSEDKKS